MKSKYYFLTSGLLAAGFAMSAQAGNYGEPVAGMGKMGGDCPPGMGRMGGECMGMDKMRSECMMMGWHKMTGTVDRIDHAKGTVTLKSGAADMALHFPPASLKDLKSGDTITVDLGFNRGAPAAMD
jgi:hypothetical protein